MVGGECLNGIHTVDLAFYPRADNSECCWKLHHFSHNFRNNCENCISHGTLIFVTSTLLASFMQDNR